MVVGGGKIPEIKGGDAGNAVRDHSLGAIRPGRRFAQEKLGHLAQRRGFATRMVPDKKTVIGGKPVRGVFLLACQFAGARKGRTGFRRLLSFGPDQRIAEAGLQVQPVDPRCGSRHGCGEFVGQFDCLAEMGGGLLERGAA